MNATVIGNASWSVFSMPTFAFDGHEFTRPFGTEWAMGLLFLEMAYRARRGDAVARELLAVGFVTIPAVGGRMYWPMPEADKSVIVE